MTFGCGTATERPKTSGDTMDSRFTPNIEITPYVSTCADLSMSTDFMDASIYASSPNSLFMYDQEKMDMQCTLGINTSCSSNFSDSFDLESKYEISQNLNTALPMCVTSLLDQSSTSSMICDSGGGGWGSSEIKESEKLVMIKSETPDDVSTPTLAELNLNLDLLEDIETVINVEMNHSPSLPKLETRSDVKQEVSQTYSQDTSREANKGYELTQYDHEVLRQRKLSQKVATLPCATTVKTEPGTFDLQGSNQGHSQGRQSATYIQIFPEDRKPIVTTSQLATIKELDISDNSVLQQLLMNRVQMQQKVPRKRTISEPTRSVLGKRSVASAGLESMDRKWEEIVEFIHTGSQKELKQEEKIVPPLTIKRERKRYDSASSVLTITSNEDDNSDSDHDYDDDSDSDMEGGYDMGSLKSESLIGGTKEKQYFWQYNVQSKGPKGTRVHFDLEEDPHALNDFEDPVFDPSNSKITGIGFSVKHGGKARKGDGNDIVPSPKKLCQIGLQLRKISRQISDFVPVSELPSSARNKSRKEKNKLASRACRLKKKAQHEANKIKLHGLEKEHRQLLTLMRAMRPRLLDRLQKNDASADQPTMTQVLEELTKQYLDTKIAGHTPEFVNSVVRKVEEGDLSGGIHVQMTRSYPKELHN